jgi:signal transduction histidine kinase
LSALAEDELDLGPVAVGPLVDDRAAAVRSAYPEATVATDVPDGVSALADETLKNVVGNLLRNAIEHNDTDSPTVEVSVTESADAVTLRVADDGPGIPDDKKDVVFRRGNRGLKEADIGSGFGLFFVDALVDGYGGSVTVEDNEPRGAVFAVTLRKPDADPDDAAR